MSWVLLLVTSHKNGQNNFSIIIHNSSPNYNLIQAVLQPIQIKYLKKQVEMQFLVCLSRLAWCKIM
jgi:hypothetical protein